MDALIARLSKDFEEMKTEIQTDKIVETWSLTDPYLIGTIIMGYLFFALRLGPDIMKGREPFDLKILMILYNAFQVVFNMKIFLAMFLTKDAISFLIDNLCEIKTDIMNSKLNHPLYIVGCEFGWYYLLSKIIDLLDTIFFVLRKKQSHVTFLHVYHHSNLVFVAWAYLKYIRGYQGQVIGCVNALVHIVMYFYYFLTAFGDTFKPFLTWKSYITKLQLTQFAFIICYLGSLLLFDCALPKVYSYYMLANGMLFFYLFLDFYNKTYINKDENMEKQKKKEKSKKKNNTTNNKKTERQIAVPGSEFFKVLTHGLSFMCFPGLQDELYNDDETDDKTQ